MATTRVMLSYAWNNAVNKNESDDDLGISESVLKIARKELREDKSAREQSLEQFKDWIRKNEDVQNVRTDDKFLLRFLRAKKFSVPMAEQQLLKYLNLKKVFPEMTANLDFLSPSMNELISSGYCFVSPIKDQSGRRVVIACAKNFNPHKHKSTDMAKAHILAFETLLEEPENQVLGITHIGDLAGISGAHVSCWNPSDFARILKWGEQSIPMRHKAIHCVNVPQAVKWVLDYAKSRVSNKIKERFQIHTTVAELHKRIDPSCLPLEMGGTMPMSEMIESWKRELATKRDLLVALDNMQLLNDRGIINKNDKNNNTGIDSIAGSFRKLEVD